MMYEVVVRNKLSNQTLTLTNNETAWQITEITGLDPADATINTTNIAGLDGSMFNSARVGNRNIVINMKINGNAETNRHTLYSWFQPKEQITFYYKNPTRDVMIDGYIEKVSCPIFVGSEIIQISIICNSPYFLENRIRTGTVAPAGSSITNANREIGMKFTITASANFNKIVLTNVSTVGGTQTITIDGSFLTGDVISVNTAQGFKSVMLTRNGATTNIFSCTDIDSEFFPLYAGSNGIYYMIDETASFATKAAVVFTYQYEYEGV